MSFFPVPVATQHVGNVLGQPFGVLWRMWHPVVLIVGNTSAECYNECLRLLPYISVCYSPDYDPSARREIRPGQTVGVVQCPSGGCSRRPGNGARCLLTNRWNVACANSSRFLLASHARRTSGSEPLQAVRCSAKEGWIASKIARRRLCATPSPAIIWLRSGLRRPSMPLATGTARCYSGTTGRSSARSRRRVLAASRRHGRLGGWYCS